MKRMFLSDYVELMSSAIEIRDMTPVYPMCFQYLDIMESEYQIVRKSDGTTVYAYQLREDHNTTTALLTKQVALMKSLDYSITNKKRVVRMFTDGYLNQRIADMDNYLHANTVWYDNKVTCNLYDEYKYIFDIMLTPTPDTTTGTYTRFTEIESSWNTKEEINIMLDYPELLDSQTDLYFDFEYDMNIDSYSYSHEYLKIMSRYNWDFLKAYKYHRPIIFDHYPTIEGVRYKLMSDADIILKGVIKYLSKRTGRPTKDGKVVFNYACTICEHLRTHGYDKDYEYLETYIHMYDNIIDTIVDMTSKKSFDKSFIIDKIGSYSYELKYNTYKSVVDNQTGETKNNSTWFYLVRAVENAVNQMKRFNASSLYISATKSENKEDDKVSTILDKYSADCSSTLDELYSDIDVFKDFMDYVKTVYPKRYDDIVRVYMLRAYGMTNKEIADNLTCSVRKIERLNTFVLKTLIPEYRQLRDLEAYDNSDFIITRNKQA